MAEEVVERQVRPPLTHVPNIRLTREPADLGNSGWKVQLGCTGASDGASALLKTWSKGELSGCRGQRG